ncbi:MAG TPA: amino acid ABC transporter permease [Atribacter sp.]|uniref:Inner membrane amino-acid ABC transporter permease protein YecS n=1 Tax=Candidatus Atribacter allofermentans TaxID=1852833 RepID=A0A1V5SJT6_9BACT|nr:amino acid ABC transporter permease [Atribacter sp.]MDD3714348.1 amino acid ABC transporter permease [Atribacterota bacterium]OQA54768.1 MAG: Inner membrane amino-acid ABC transporter permease protein YecS [Candidatus Atribacteria bacterium ADurb.Bin276]HHT08897.1 amino acid ABC transporter permease [Candidatus Atribacteria bacterium]MDI9594949.1 amino acid ABC transporter permease [Atribacterota bacterium]HQK83247.1 amino acid ABC transporter permease [Atribacter sp.]
MEQITITEQLIRLGGAFIRNLEFLPWVLLIGVVFGLLFALIRFHRIPVLNFIVMAFVEIMRGAPFLIIVFAVYFALPYMGIQLDAIASGIVVLSMSATAYLSEIFRGGLMAIDKGQFEAADALGLTYFQKLRFIILPQMIKISLPSMIGQIVLTIKDTSIVSLVGVVEIVRTSRQIMQITLDPFTAFGIVSIYFAIVCYPLIYFSQRLERRLQK